MLEVALFGHLRLTYDGKNVPFAVRPKVAPLLAFLLLNCRQPVSRESVAFALWPDESEETARANLRRHLHYLREILPPSRTPWLIADARTVCWNPAAPVQVDVADFERLATEPAELERAVALYGELLQGYDDEWLLATRERLRRLYVHSLWDLVRRARGRRDRASASDYLGRILADDPWREDAVRALMAVRCESGDRGSALQLCAEFEQRLKHEMGASLMPETAALRYAIERENPLPAVPLAPAPQSATVSSADLPFEGRSAELAQLRDLWERAIAGYGAFALVLGEAGIGKTRLASEFALTVEATGGRVFWGTTSAPETVPYQALTEVARAALGFVDASSLSPYDLDVLARLIPELREGESPNDPGGGPDAAKLFDVIGNLFVELGRRRPALFVFEDLHGAGPATVAMLEHVTRRCSQAPILILATLREDEALTAETLGRLRRPRGGPAPSIIPLAALSKAAVESIVAQSLGAGAGASRLAARSAGHPLFLAELLYAATDEPDQSMDGVPMRLRAIIDARSRRFSEEAGFLLRAAAVVGNSFDLEVVAETVGWSESRLAAAADELIARRVIRQTPSARSYEYEFAHDLIASAAYESVPERERRHWHRRAGRAAEHWYGSRLSDLAAFVARHFELGGEYETAAAYYLRAARRAAGAFANDEALAYARRGLGLKPRSPADRYELLALTEEVLGLLGEREEQGTVLRKLDRAARRLGDVQRLREVLRRRANLHQYLGECNAALRTFARLYQLAAGDARWEAIALRGQAVILNQSGLKPEAHETIRRATARASAANDDAVLALTLVVHSDLAASLGQRAEAESCLQRVKDAARRTESLFLAARAVLNEMNVSLHFRDWPRVVEEAPRLLELAATVGSRYMAADAHALLGVALGLLLDLEGARRHLSAAIELYRACSARGLFLAYNNLAAVETEIGRLDNAQQVLDEIAKAFQEIGREQRAMADLIAAEIARQREEFDVAMALAESVISAAAALGNELFEADALHCKGVSLRASGRAGEAIPVLERCLAIRRCSKVEAPATCAAAELALACALAGDARARSFADETLASSESNTGEPDSPEPLWALSQAFDAMGRAIDARKVLTRAHDAFQARRKRLQSARDRAAFSRMPVNAALERACQSGVADSGACGATAGNPRVRRAAKTRTAARLRPREQSL